MLRIQQSKILLYIAPVLLALFFAGSILFLKTSYFIAFVGIIVVLPIFVIYPEISLVFYTTSIGCSPQAEKQKELQCLNITGLFFVL